MSANHCYVLSTYLKYICLLWRNILVMRLLELHSIPVFPLYIPTATTTTKILWNYCSYKLGSSILWRYHWVQTNQHPDSSIPSFKETWELYTIIKKRRQTITSLFSPLTGEVVKGSGCMKNVDPVIFQGRGGAITLSEGGFIAIHLTALGFIPPMFSMVFSYSHNEVKRATRNECLEFHNAGIYGLHYRPS